MKLQKAFGIFQNLIIIFLLLSMLIFVGKYLSIRTGVSGSSLPQMPESEKAILQRSFNENVVENNSNLIIPTFLGVSVNGEKKAAFDEEKYGDLWDISVDYLGFLLEGETKKINFQTDEEKNNYFNEIIKKPDYLYFEFYNSLPASVVSSLISKNNTLPKNNEIFELKKAFIFADNIGRLGGIFINNDGQAYECSTDTATFNKDILIAYNYKAEFISFKFNYSNAITPISLLTKAVNFKSIAIHNKKDYFGFLPNEEKTEKLLALFKFNPSNTKYYQSANGKYTYVEENGEIEVSEDGKIIFTSSENAIHLSKYLNYYPESDTDSYKFSDKITAMRCFVNLLSEEILNIDAKIGLTGVYYNESGEIETEFKYFINGLYFDNEKSDIVLKFKGNRLVYADIKCIYFDEMSLETLDLPQDLAFELITDKYAEDIIGFDGTYKKVNSIYDDEIYSQTWILRLENAENSR